MPLSRAESRTALEMLADIRRKQNKTIDTMRNDWRQLMHFECSLEDLAAAAEFGSTLTPQPTTPQSVSLSRDLKEFGADLSEVRQFVGNVTNVAREVKDYMTAVKATLDIIQTRFEENDV